MTEKNNNGLTIGGSETLPSENMDQSVDERHSQQVKSVLAQYESIKQAYDLDNTAFPSGHDLRFQLVNWGEKWGKNAELKLTTVGENVALIHQVAKALSKPENEEYFLNVNKRLELAGIEFDGNTLHDQERLCAKYAIGSDWATKSGILARESRKV